MTSAEESSIIIAEFVVNAVPVIDATVFIAESVDNEHVNSNRAQLFQTSFTQALGVAAQSRSITDTERGGLDEEDVA